MLMAQSSSFSTIDNKKEKVVVCNCNFEAKVLQAWTVDNPGRRFYTCEGRRVSNGYQTCNFFRWYDVEKPHGWQYTALLGARNVMRQQREEISNLRNQVRELSLENVRIGRAVRLENESSGQTPPDSDLNCEACEALRGEILVLNERSMVYRNVLITLAVGFTVVICVFMGILKW
ncbi:hypothetical protein HID58_064610 [Brassica napus]|uniref:GRF-type domain-containing protein n=2 Tax=Brassica napus TaxID=3708 RepID=A0ABQ7ZAH3_BRANA|nr:hypothetical protein HID58_064610 [Brassica napus]